LKGQAGKVLRKIRTPAELGGIREVFVEVEVGGLDVGRAQGFERGAADDAVVDMASDGKGEEPMGERIVTGGGGDGVADFHGDFRIALARRGGEHVFHPVAAEQGLGEVQRGHRRPAEARDEIFFDAAAALDGREVAVLEAPPGGLGENVEDQVRGVAEHSPAAGEGGVVWVRGDDDRMRVLHRRGRIFGDWGSPEKDEALVLQADQIVSRDVRCPRDLGKRARAVAELERVDKRRIEATLAAVDAFDAGLGERVVREAQGKVRGALGGAEASAELVLELGEHCKSSSASYSIDPEISDANIMNLIPLLASLEAEPQTTWAPIVLLIIIGVGFAAVNVAASIFIGPGRTGPGKEETYESGMVPVGDTRKRFNVRFYIVAMIFLVFDVEIVFFYPWATIFPDAIAKGAPGGSGLLLIEIVLFVLILLLAYVYAWGKGVFQWD
jgi:NADH-quinone oxidoreductase subunit A